MRMVLILVLCLFWIAMAYRQYQRGDMMMAGVFAVTGAALTTWRIAKSRE